jgi:hypothetical protein
MIEITDTYKKFNERMDVAYMVGYCLGVIKTCRDADPSKREIAKYFEEGEKLWEEYKNKDINIKKDDI